MGNPGRTRTATVAVAVLAMLSVTGLVVSLSAARSGLDPGGQSAPAQEPAQEPAQKPATTGPVVAEVRPVRLTIGAADLTFPVLPVGVTADGQMALPANPRVLGWYAYGPGPGAAAGSVVLAGHLDSLRYGLGPLVRLREVEIGDTVQVRTSAGRARTYVVTAVDRFDRRALPAALFSRTGRERLRVITCGGEYDVDAGGYQENLVVTAEPG